MAQHTREEWYIARDEAFNAFGVLYYPLFDKHDDIANETVTDEDMAWAVTANANLAGTGYTLSQQSVLTLAAYHHAVADLAAKAIGNPLAAAFAQFAAGGQLNPLNDIKRLVPDVTAMPMYPDFPTQVMEISEAQFRYDQMCHYASTYGVELVAGLLGLNVTVGKGWLPDVQATEKTQTDDKIVPDKVLHLVMTVEDMQSIVAARLARATRMHDAEVATALLVFGDMGDEAEFPKVAFHENMMELIRHAAAGGADELARVAGGLSQHPGDILKAIRYVMEVDGTKHLKTRQKKGFCRALEGYGTMAIAHNIADAGKTERIATNYLSVARFGGTNLRTAIDKVERGEVRSWNAELESLWTAVDTAHGSDSAWKALLSHYGQRPGMLFRALTRLVKAGCPADLLLAETNAHADSYSLPTLVRTLSIMSALDRYVVGDGGRYAGFRIQTEEIDPAQSNAYAMLCPILLQLVISRMGTLDTPLRDKKVLLDKSGVSLVGSVLMPNDNGDTGTAWPPVGIAYDLPEDKTIRFFTFWDDRKKRVDVDLHFVGLDTSGHQIHIGWNGNFRGNGLATSGDITHSHDAIEFLDARMAEAKASGVDFVIQEQHIYCGASDWKDIATCYSGAVVVGRTAPDVKHVSPDNLVFRDDLTGEGRSMAYAIIDVPNHYVRIVRGAQVPFIRTAFTLEAYLKALFIAQGVTLVSDEDEADLKVCVGRSDDPSVISLFDEGFYLG